MYELNLTNLMLLVGKSLPFYINVAVPLQSDYSLNSYSPWFRLPSRSETSLWIGPLIHNFVTEA